MAPCVWRFKQDLLLTAVHVLKFFCFIEQSEIWELSVHAGRWMRMEVSCEYMCYKLFHLWSIIFQSCSEAQCMRKVYCNTISIVIPLLDGLLLWPLTGISSTSQDKSYSDNDPQHLNHNAINWKIVLGQQDGFSALDVSLQRKRRVGDIPWEFMLLAKDLDGSK